MVQTPHDGELKTPQTPDEHNGEQPYYAYPGRRQSPSQHIPGRQRRSSGRWLAFALLAFLVIGTAAFVLFAPPLELARQVTQREYTRLDAENNAVAVMRVVEREGLSGVETASEPAFTLSIDPSDTGSAFGVAMDVIAAQSFTAEGSGPDWIEQARSTLMPYLSPITDLYVIETDGTPPAETVITFDLETTVTEADRIDLYGWHTDAQQWRFIPSNLDPRNNQISARVEQIPNGVALFDAAPPDPIIRLTLNFTQTITRDAADLADIVSPVGMQPTLATGNQTTLTGNLASGFEIGGSYRVMPVIRNYADLRATDTDTVTRLLTDSALLDSHVRHIAAFVSAGGYSGVFIDYRDVPADQRDSFTRFIKQLADALHQIDAQLGVIVPSAENIDGRWQTGAYDWQGLGAAVDHLQVELPLDPTAYIPGDDRLVDAMLRWGVKQVSRYKLVGGLSALSLRQHDQTFEQISYDSALEGLGDVDIELEGSGQLMRPGSEIRLRLDGFNALPGQDEQAQTPFIDYFTPAGDLNARVWLSTRGVIRFRMERLSPFGIGGIAFDNLLQPGVAAGVLEEILNYTIQIPAPEPDGTLRLNWRISGADGTTAQEFTSGFNEEIVVTLAGPEGEYDIAVDVIGETLRSQRDSAAVAMFQPTPTATRLPTSTPAPLPTSTPTLIPVVPTPGSSMASTPLAGLFPPVAPGPGSIALGAFEYGGHVTDASSGAAVNAMRNAGMTWMKVQVRFGPGASTDYAAQTIRNAHQNGFKILLGVVGNPNDLASGGEAYIRQYAEFVGNIAALGPEAIEVWNEPNIGREWPEGRISGGNYTVLLAAAYQAIKSRNPNVMVIAGAPAPTGAQDAFPGLVVNDDVFLRDMVAAGALNYMDCLGMHYNEGLVTGSATSGDPRDDYYTRYLPTLLDTYVRITGGQRPICITELGYVSPQGFSSLPLTFAWAQNLTVEQQAAFLADAATYASQSGHVRLMIVWNIDFERYDEDPMAGYAIIRPDGSCPACAALAGAR